MASLNPMLRAAQKNDCEEAARLARVHPEWAKEKLDDGDTALHIAARHGTLELVKLLLPLTPGGSSAQGKGNETPLETLERTRPDDWIATRDYLIAAADSRNTSPGHLGRRLSGKNFMGTQFVRPPLLGGFKLQEQVYYCGKNKAWDNSDDRLEYGQRGQITGQSESHPDDKVHVMFPGNGKTISCDVTKLNRNPPPPRQEICYRPLAPRSPTQQRGRPAGFA